MKCSRGQFVKFSNNHRLVYKCSSVRSLGRIEGEGVHDEGVDVANGHRSYCTGRCRLDVLVVIGNRRILFEKQNVFKRSAIIEVHPYKTMW